MYMYFRVLRGGLCHVGGKTEKKKWDVWIAGNACLALVIPNSPACKLLRGQADNLDDRWQQRGGRARSALLTLSATFYHWGAHQPRDELKRKTGAGVMGGMEAGREVTHDFKRNDRHNSVLVMIWVFLKYPSHVNSSSEAWVYYLEYPDRKQEM